MGMHRPFFRCTCGKVHTRSPLTFGTAALCTCGRELNLIAGTVKEA